jgi:mRNA-degrading endonuclease RelE of RelBE toxin-antitoxin system
MTRASKYSLFYDDETQVHLQYIEKKQWKLIKETIESQLEYEPNVESKNRKPLRHPPIQNRWEIRFGNHNEFRVFYSVNELEREVSIHIIAVKKNNRLCVGNEVIEL